jgi:hypothetical protein
MEDKKWKKCKNWRHHSKSLQFLHFLLLFLHSHPAQNFTILQPDWLYHSLFLHHPLYRNRSECCLAFFLDCPTLTSW